MMYKRISKKQLEALTIIHCDGFVSMEDSRIDGLVLHALHNSGFTKYVERGDISGYELTNKGRAEINQM